MSWLFSRALVEASSAGNNLDGAACALWRSNPIKHLSWLPAKTKDHCRLSQSGMTFAVFEDTRGEELLTWFQEASHVRTFPVPEKGPDWRVSEADYGGKWRELWAKFNHESCSWKTHRCLWEEDLDWSSVIWPRWGMMLDGVLWGRVTPELRTNENASGSWPTPVKYDATPGGPGNHYKGLGWQGKHGFPTPLSSQRGDCKTYQTPTVADSKPGVDDGWSPLGRDVKQTAAEGLNPEWVEWLMGWPENWTNIETGVSPHEGWSEDPADSGWIGRTTPVKKFRRERLSALGNGQVPQALVLAFRTLYG